MELLDYLKISDGIANGISYKSPVLGTGTYSGHVGPNNLPEGHGVFINDLDIEYNGEWKDGRLCGMGRKYARSYIDVMRAEGDEVSRSLFYVGEFKDDKYHGQGKLYNQFCTLEYDGQWEDGWRSGQGTEYYPIGFAKYVGTWKRGRYHGKGVYTFANRDIIKGQWKNGLLEGRAEFITRDGRIYEQEYFNDKLLSERRVSRSKL